MQESLRDRLLDALDEAAVPPLKRPLVALNDPSLVNVLMTSQLYDHMNTRLANAMAGIVTPGDDALAKLNRRLLEAHQTKPLGLSELAALETPLSLLLECIHVCAATPPLTEQQPLVVAVYQINGTPSGALSEREAPAFALLLAPSTATLPLNHCFLRVKEAKKVSKKFGGLTAAAKQSESAAGVRAQMLATEVYRLLGYAWLNPDYFLEAPVDTKFFLAATAVK